MVLSIAIVIGAVHAEVIYHGGCAIVVFALAEFFVLE